MRSLRDLVTTDIGEAVDALTAGGLVAIPTETVYGLAAIADRPEAVRRIYTVKGRPSDHPLIVHLAAADALDGWVTDVPTAATILADACWPGPLTMLLPRGPRTGDWITGGRSTVGVRVPAHPLTLALLERLDSGVLDPARDRILDGGACQVGVESTIVDLTTDPPQLLRAGAIDADTVDRLLDTVVAAASGPSRAAGMLDSHYAPDCRVVLAESTEELERSAARARAAGARVTVLDRTDDLVAAAQLLYDDLRRADRSGTDVLVVRMPPAAGLGHAIRDRLTKAAAGR